MRCPGDMAPSVKVLRSSSPHHTGPRPARPGNRLDHAVLPRKAQSCPGFSAYPSQFAHGDRWGADPKLVQESVPVRGQSRRLERPQVLRRSIFRFRAERSGRTASPLPIQVRGEPGQALALDWIELIPEFGHLVLDPSHFFGAVLAFGAEAMVTQEPVGGFSILLIDCW